MRVIDLLRLALRNALRSGVKALLCAGAVCIGICSVCTVWGIGGAAQTAILGELDQLGVGGMVFYNSKDVSVGTEEVDAVKQINGVLAAMPFFYKSGSAKLNATKTNAALCGVGEDLDNVLNVNLLFGRLPQHSDVISAAKVAVVDEQLAVKVYQRTNIVGKTITLSVEGASAPFQIIGVIASQKQGLETMIGGSLPCMIYLPHTSLEELAGSTKKMLAVSCFQSENSEEVADSVKRKLKYVTDIDFSYEDLNQYAGSVQNITSAVTSLISGVAAISIFVGGLGVMNAMVAVVDSRVGEIGIWLALGAHRWFIAACYLFEALFICLAGGVAGSAFAALALAGIQRATAVAIPIQISDLALGVAGAAACGMLFGLLPALRAARMNPIDAIRTD